MEILSLILYETGVGEMREISGLFSPISVIFFSEFT